MEIRPARQEDATELAQLWREFGAYYAVLNAEQFQVPEADGLARHLARRLRSPDEQWIVAELEGELAGLAVGSVSTPAPDASRFMINDRGRTRLGIEALVVGERFRRRGVARTLIGELERWGREQGAAVVLTETYAESPAAVPFWETSPGYRQVSKRYRKLL